MNEKAKQDSVLFVKHAYRYDTLKKEFITKKTNEPSHRTLFLLSKKCDTDFFSNIPKTFTISTKNTTLYFNIQILKETSPVISKFIEDNPNKNNYFINVTDDENVLMKIEQLYQGKSVIFKETDIPLVHQFIELLQIKNCPSYLKQKPLSRKEFDSDGYHQFNFYYSPHPKFFEATVEIYLDFFIKFLKRDDHQAFKIKTNKKEYVCNIFAVYTSKIISQILEKDPTTTEFVYNFDDNENEFQLICDFFNYKKIDLKKVNINSIKLIAEDLQISCILKFIDDYNDHCKKFEQKIEKHKKTIETIGELFDLLYNIKKYGIEKVKDSIVQSKWTKTEEDVQELAAFILQVIKPSFSMQKEISELIIQLSKESNDQNKLNILIPFIVDQLMTLYWPNLCPYKIKNIKDNSVTIQEDIKRVAKYAFKTQEIINLTNKCVYSFIRILYKRGVIPKEEIENRLKNYDLSNNVINSFFFPELIKFHSMNKFEYMYMKKSRTIDSIKDIVSKGSVNTARLNYFFSKIVKKYLPDKIDLYEKMLDEMEPDDELTRILRHDDVDELKKILMKDEAPSTVPYNIFDDFEEDLNLLNYAAYTGSLKCFKYLMSNNNKIDESTFYFAVCGGNDEIIKIVYQQTSFEKGKDVFKCFNNDINYLNINGGNMIISFWFIFNRSDKSLNEFTGYDNYLSISNDKYNDGNVQYYKLSNNGDFDFILNYSNINNIIASSIALNKNDLFDYIFENIFVKNDKYENDLIYIALLSAICGNVHSLITLIDNGLHISKEIISNCANNGFYTLAKLLLDLFDEHEQINSKISYDPFDFKSIVNFGNLQIFQLFIDKMSQYDILNTILFAIERNYSKIVHYVFDNVDKFDIIYNKPFIYDTLKFSTRTKSNELFDFLYEQYKKLRPELINIEWFTNLLKSACKYSNFAVAKELTDLILKEKPDHDFKTAFFAASYSKSTNICHYFLEQKAFINFNKIENISDLGAVDVEFFERIINNVDPNRKYLYYGCINEAIDNKNMKLVEFILKINPPKDLELIEAVRTEEIEFVDLILKYNSEPSFVNRRTREGTALCIATLLRSLEIVKRLLSIPGIDLNIFNEENYAPLTIAANNRDTEIVDEILKCYKNNNLKVPASIIANSMTWIFRGSNTLVIDAVWQIIKRLLEVQFIDPYMYKYKHFSNYKHPLLILACSKNRIDIVETFIRLNYDVNVYDRITLNTPLIISLELNFLEIARLLIKCPKTNINLLNTKNESALTIAIKNGQKEIIDLILNDEKFDPKASKLNQSFIFANNEISTQLLPLKFLDANEGCLIPGNLFDIDFNIDEMYMKPRQVNALIFSVLTNNVDKIDMIINHPSFNIVKSRVKKAIFTAAKTNNIVIFRKLFKLVNNDINLRCNKKESLISYAAIYQSGEIVDEIINGNDQICDAFVKSYSIIKIKKKSFQDDYDFALFEYNFDFDPIWIKSFKIIDQDSLPKISSLIEIMQKLLDYDLNHDHLINFDQLLQSGKSYFTVIPSDYSDIGAVCQFLIQHGVDPNKMDKNGIYPLEHAIKINSIDFVTSLLNSEKIDFNTKLKNGFTFLHIAAQNKDSSFLKLLLQKNKIDINSVNDDGETPLIIACKCNCIDNINLLFKSDELDYLYKNKNGKDALDIISNSMPQNELESIKQNKEKYHNKLISIIDEMINSNS